jgi:dynein heavy chain, axonemal
LIKDFEPYRALWITASDWIRWHESWMNDALVEVDAEKVDKNVAEAYKLIHKSVKIFQESAGKLSNNCCLIIHV